MSTTVTVPEFATLASGFDFLLSSITVPRTADEDRTIELSFYGGALGVCKLITDPERDRVITRMVLAEMRAHRSHRQSQTEMLQAAHHGWVKLLYDEGELTETQQAALFHTFISGAVVFIDGAANGDWTEILPDRFTTLKQEVEAHVTQRVAEHLEKKRDLT